jgi:hypothetical protein
VTVYLTFYEVIIFDSFAVACLSAGAIPESFLRAF